MKFPSTFTNLSPLVSHELSPSDVIPILRWRLSPEAGTVQLRRAVPRFRLGAQREESAHQAATGRPWTELWGFQGWKGGIKRRTSAWE